MDIITTLITCLTSCSVIELARWLYNRKPDKAKREAEAMQTRIAAKEDEHDYLRKRLELVEKDVYEKEQRFLEINAHVRELSAQLLEKEATNGKLAARVAELEAEQKMKLCRVRGCDGREPQSGY